MSSSKKLSNIEEIYSDEVNFRFMRALKNNGVFDYCRFARHCKEVGYIKNKLCLKEKSHLCKRYLQLERELRAYIPSKEMIYRQKKVKK